MQDTICTSLRFEIPLQGQAGVTVEVIRCSAHSYAEIYPRLESMDQQWRALASESQAANPFLEAWCLKPALQHLAQENIDLLVVWQDEQQQKMLMLVPLVSVSRFHHIPMRHHAVWRHPYCYLCTPLISPDLPVNFWLQLMATLSGQLKPGDCVTHGWMNTERLLQLDNAESVATSWHIALDEQVKSRAGVQLEGSYSDFLGNLRRKKRKDLQRSRRRFSELGELAVSVISEQSDSNTQLSAVDEFLSLENRGWKKAGNTAIACNPKHELYFRQLIRNGLQSGQLLIMRMALDNQAVALLVVLVSACGKCGYTLKIATDANFHKYSLGSLLILEFTEHAFANLDLSLLDSCAAENHPMINSLWKHKVTLDNLTLVRKNSWRKPLVNTVRWLRSARNKTE